MFKKFIFPLGLFISGSTFAQTFSTQNLTNWQLTSNESKIDGKLASTKQFNSTTWKKAIVPGTVLHSLVENKVYTDIYFGKNLEKIDTKQFDNAWWYRNSFEIKNLSVHTSLVIEGINYKANVWLNGKLLADSSVVKNSFRQFDLNITSHLLKGTNTLAIEVFPPKKGDYSIGFVDWNPTPPDQNMGIFRNVYLMHDGGVNITKPFVQTNLNVTTLKEADLLISAEIENTTAKDMNGEVEGTIGTIVFNQKVQLKPNEKKMISFTPRTFPQLHVTNPRIWWPHTLGKPELYKMQLRFKQNASVLDEENVEFGIRKVSDYKTAKGERAYKINGQPYQIRGGGWVDELTLADTRSSIKAQLDYVKDMGLNTVRLEGFWGKDHTIYELCDKMGLLVMVGWSCHWEWEDYLGTFCDEKYGGILKPTDINMMAEAWKDQIVWLRNHPSVFVWMSGSDCIPKPELEQKYFDIFKQYDTTRTYLAAAKEWTSLAGPSAVKMRGPYDYEPPVYWYSDTLYGGAFGFNTETGPGAQVPPLESLKKMIPKDQLWPTTGDMWEYHCGRHAFNKLDLNNQAIEKRYGKMNTIEEYAAYCQILNYELMRPMFEAFASRKTTATGIVQWMLNSAWPDTYWQLYDAYLMPNGAYYGAKKACKPLHLIYDYHAKTIILNNDHLQEFKNLLAVIKMYDSNSKVIGEKEIQISINPNSNKTAFTIPAEWLKEGVSFLDLRLLNNSTEIDNNFYWLSSKADILDYEAKVPGWNFHTPSKQYADFTAFKTMTKTEVKSSISEWKQEGEYMAAEVTLTNSNHGIALGLALAVLNKATNESILPVLWEDNYVNLLPNETRKLKVRVSAEHVKTSTVLKVEGVNLK